MMECAEAMEQGMLHTQTTRDMWQNDLVWWICKAEKLLLEERIREREKKRKSTRKRILTTLK